MTTARVIPPPYETYRDLTGAPLENGYIYIGQANLDPVANPITVYEDLALTVPVTQPIRTTAGVPYNTSGRAINLYTSVDYSILIRDKKGTQVWNESLVEGQQVDEWQYSLTATYVSSTVFTLVGDQTGTYEAGRACRVTSAGPTYAYATISTSVFTTVTTVTLDDTVVPAGLTDSAVSIVGPNSVPTDPQVAINTADIATNAADIATNVTDIAARLPLAGGNMTGQIELTGTPSGNQAAQFDQIKAGPSQPANTAGTGTTLGTSETLVASETLTLPTDETWKWVDVYFTTELPSNANIEATSVKLGAVSQTVYGNLISYTSNNSDNAMQIMYYVGFVPSTTGSNITVDFYAKSSGTGDTTSKRNMTVLGWSK